MSNYPKLEQFVNDTLISSDIVHRHVVSEARDIYEEAVVDYINSNGGLFRDFQTDKLYIDGLFILMIKPQGRKEDVAEAIASYFQEQYEDDLSDEEEILNSFSEEEIAEAYINLTIGSNTINHSIVIEHSDGKADELFPTDDKVRQVLDNVTLEYLHEYDRPDEFIEECIENNLYNIASQLEGILEDEQINPSLLYDMPTDAIYLIKGSLNGDAFTDDNIDYILRYYGEDLYNIKWLEDVDIPELFDMAVEHKGFSELYAYVDVDDVIYEEM